jgi:antitoxin PrlF
MTSKGQITVPARVRAAMGLNAGDRVEFVEVKKGEFVIVPVTRSLRELNGMFKGRRSRPATIDEMDAAIARGSAGSR